MRRREMLATLGSAASLSVAGCAGLSGSDDEDDPGNDARTEEESDEENGEQTTEEPEDEAPEEVREVAPGESIQQAVDEIAAGGRIDVREGTYEQSVTVDKALTLIAPDGAVLTGVDIDAETAITISEAGVEIEGFEIRRYVDGIVTNQEVGDLTITDVQLFENEGNAISVAGASVDVAGVLAENNGATALTVESTRNGTVTVRDVEVNLSEGAAVSIDGGQSVVIDQFDALQNRGSGVEVTGGTARGQTIEIRGSTVVENGGDGIVGTGTGGEDQIAVANAEITDNAARGIRLESVGDGDVTVDNTEVTDNGDDGVRIVGGTAVTFDGVSVLRNGDDGIEISAENVRSQTIEVLDTAIEANGDYGFWNGGSGSVDEVRIESVSAKDNGDVGIKAVGAVTEVTGVDVRNNRSDEAALWIESTATGDVTVSDTNATDNGDDGIRIDGGETVTVGNATVLRNGNDGIEINSGDASGQTVEVLDSTTEANGDYGIWLGGSNGEDDLTVRNVTSNNNGDVGLRAIGEVVEVVDVDVLNNDPGSRKAGLQIDSSATGEVTVRNVRVEDNSNDGVAIEGGETVTVDNATVLRNDDDGVEFRPGDVSGQTVAVLDSTVEANGDYGIWLSGSSGSDEVRLSSVDSNDNGDYGLALGGETITIENSTATNNYNGNLELHDSSREDATIVNSDV